MRTLSEHTLLPEGRSMARIYGFIRTAHLERFREMVPATVLYRKARYDYDDSILPPAQRPIQLGRLATVGHLLRHRYRAVEVNEPGVTNLWLDTLSQVIAIRLRGGLGEGRTQIVTYCIGYSDPAQELHARRPYLPLPLTRAATRFFLGVLGRSMDRIAFGTEGSLAMYREYVPERVLTRRSAMFEAVPAACSCAMVEPNDGPEVLFVGAFSDRKGVRQLMTGWDALRAGGSELRLEVIGKGPLQTEVQEWAAGRDDVVVRIDPPRTEIHAAMRRAKVLVLLSQRIGAWREQVGLPIVEGLSHGMEIVTTDETGLAPWLSARGHRVLTGATDPSAVRQAIAGAAADPRGRAEVLRDLPAADQRMEADRWMLADDVTLGDAHRLPPALTARRSESLMPALAAIRTTLRPRTRLLWTKEWLDDRFAAVARPRRSSATRRVDVVGLYRDGEQLSHAVRELTGSSHTVRFRLGSMGEASAALGAETIQQQLNRGKFQNLNELIDPDPAAFDWLLIMDDDVDLPAGFLNTMITVCEKYDLAVAQPAQTRYSNANWSVARRHFASVARLTEFVEIGPVTLIRADAARFLTPFPADLRYGWGLDFHWAAVAKEHNLRMGVVDIAAVRHVSRKVASTYSWDAAQEEGREFLRTVEHLPNTVAHATLQTFRRPIR